ncbi:unnamed protein product, partial [marine sediment metagenome]
SGDITARLSEKFAEIRAGSWWSAARLTWSLDAYIS